MIDDTLRAAITRFWTTQKVTDTYAAILEAYSARLSQVTVIIGKATEGDSASGQIVISREDYREWMDTLEARLGEIENGGATFSREAVSFQNHCIQF
jgi:putative heme degradation protein